jgi:hypothetical protein
MHSPSALVERRSLGPWWQKAILAPSFPHIEVEAIITPSSSRSFSCGRSRRGEAQFAKNEASIQDADGIGPLDRVGLAFEPLEILQFALSRDLAQAG